MKVKKLAFINGKGGVGKSTSVVHVAGVLSKMGKKVLVIDLDKQRNTSDTLLMNAEYPSGGVFDAMMSSMTADWTCLYDFTAKALLQTRANASPKHYGIDCMPADIRLENENSLGIIDAQSFGNSLDAFVRREGYDWVLVDMPPSNKTLNAICFSYIVDYIIVPFSSDIYSVSGYGDMMDTVQSARGLNPGLNTLGVYLSRYMANCAVDKHIRDQLSSYNTFIDVQIPLAADVREGIMFGRPISYYKKSSKSRSAYEALVDEIIKRIDALG